MSLTIPPYASRLRQGVILFSVTASLGTFSWMIGLVATSHKGVVPRTLTMPIVTPPITVQTLFSDTLSEDARLDVKVAITAEGIPVGDLLALLSKKTGIALRAEGYVTDDKVIVFTKERPLRAVMAGVAALFNDTWGAYPTGKGKTGYELRRSLQARAYENRLTEAIPTRFMTLLDAQVRALDETPEQLAQRPQNDPIRRNLSREEGRLVTALYSQLNAEQQRSLFANKVLSVSLNGLKSPQEQAAREAFKRSIPKRVGTTPLEGTNEVNEIAADPAVYMKNLDKYGVTFHLTANTGARTAPHLTLSAQLGLLWEELAGGSFDLDPVLLPISGNPYTGKKASWTMLPNVKTIENAAQESTFLDRLRNLATTSGISVIADYYRAPDTIQDSRAAAMASDPAASALNTLCQHEGYLWWTRGETLLLRKRDWFLQQPAEIPERWLLNMTQRLKAHKGVPTYDDLFQLKELTPTQMIGLDALLGRSEKAGEKVPALGVREALEIWQASGRDTSRTISAQGGTLPAVQADQKIAEGEGYMCYALMNGVQRSLIPDFLAAQPQHLAPEDIPILMLYINGTDTSDFSQTHTTLDGYRYAPVAVGWNLYKPYVPKSNTNGVLPGPKPLDPADFVPQWGRLWSIPLPISLPQDHREKTRIDIVE